MKILYLGWPRSGSTWLYENIKQNSNLRDVGGIKESHLLYNDPVQGLLEFHDASIDFSTNNWSMDSSIANKLDATHYIMVHRHPLEILYSYHAKLGNQWDKWQSSCLSNKLLNVGDIIERWLNLKKKILLYEFTDLSANPEDFAKMVLTDLGLPTDNISVAPVNASVSKTQNQLCPQLEELLAQQEEKFQALKGLADYRRLRH